MRFSLFIFPLIIGFSWASEVPPAYVCPELYLSKTGVTPEGKIVRHCDSVAACAEFCSSLFLVGWNFLNVSTNSALNGSSYWAGFVEGYATAPQIMDHHANLMIGMNNFSTLPPPLERWLQSNYEWGMQFAASEVCSNKQRDPSSSASFACQAGRTLQQFNGIYDGYTRARADIPGLRALSRMDLYALASLGDLFQIVPLVLPDAQFANSIGSGHDGHPSLASKYSNRSHCSVLLKQSPDRSDFYFGHTSWFTYESMLRIWKTYTAFEDADTVAEVSFSGYPLLLTSMDDFHTTSKGLVSIETSIHYFNHTLLKAIRPSSLLYWVRITLANRLANSASEWMTAMAFQNSGTYANEWMAIDTKLFVPGQAIPDNFIWVGDQLTDGVIAGDVSSYVRSQGYFPSFNVPFWKDAFDRCGYNEEGTPYQHYVRFEIFAMLNRTVVDLESYQAVMRYNAWPRGRYSGESPGSNAIASRGDLDPVRPSCFGAYDCKTASLNALRSGGVVRIQAGPTRYSQPAFSFATTRANDCGAHYGMPTAYEFDWVSAPAARFTSH